MVLRTTNRNRAEALCLRLRKRGYRFDRVGLRRLPAEMTYRTSRCGGRYNVVYWTPRKPKGPPKPCINGCRSVRRYSTGECKSCRDRRRYREDANFRAKHRAKSKDRWHSMGKDARRAYLDRRAERRRQFMEAA